MLVARAQLNFICELLARFERHNSEMGLVVDYQSQYVAINALLRSVGHVFVKVDCAEPDRHDWCITKWRNWQKEAIFQNFIEPVRNALLKEFQGGLKLQSDAFGSVVTMADPAMPNGFSRVADFDIHKACDLFGRPVLLQFHDAIAFWDRCLKEAEAAFAEPAR